MRRSQSGRHMDLVRGALGDTLSDNLGVDAQTVALVRLNRAVQVVVGGALAAGKLPRVAALALAVSLVATTLADHRFWEAADDTGGRPSIPWRIHEAVHHARAGLTHVEIPFAIHG